jgi:PPOX class probable F420-dependent enzyme
MSGGDERLLDIVAGTRRGVLVTLKRDGRPQLSNVDFAWDPDRRLARVSTRSGLAKVANLRRDARASLHVAAPGGGAYVVLEGVVSLSPVAGDVDDATVAELVDVYRAVQGEHPDWDDYRRAMVADQRLVVRLPVERWYGWSP